MAKGRLCRRNASVDRNHGKHRKHGNSTDSVFNANYARRTTAPRRDGLRPRGCWLVLLRSVCDASVFLTSRTVLLATHVVNHKSSEASATINCQLQAKRICARARSAEKLGTIDCDVVALAHIRAPSASACS